jgi:hypothetical protein
VTEIQSTGRFTAELRLLMNDSYDVCRSCGAKLAEGDVALAGYARSGQPLYVSACCASELEELASHVYWWWKFDKRVDQQVSIWRFVDFAKFVMLLEQRALYFPRADQLGDKFELAVGIEERRPQYEAFYRDFFREAVRSAPGGRELDMASTEVEVDRLFGDFERTFAQDRLRTFASCWHANEGESEALWRLYAPPGVPGVAIRSDVGALRLSLRNDPNIEIGKVRYVDLRQSYTGMHDRIFWKRKSLSHESEVRAVLKKLDPQDDVGVEIPVDLQLLIRAVVPSPFAPSWLGPLLKAVLKRYGVEVPTRRSELLAEPFF